MDRHRTFTALTVALVALLVASCALGRAEGTPPPPGDADGNPRPPAGAIEVGGRAFPLGLGSYCWSGPADDEDSEDHLAVCVDAIGIITSDVHARAAPGATLTIVGDLAALDFQVRRAHLFAAPAEPVATGNEPVPWEAWQPEGLPLALDVDGHSLGLPADLDPGRYLLAIDITPAAAPGDASYGAVIEVR